MSNQAAAVGEHEDASSRREFVHRVSASLLAAAVLPHSSAIASLQPGNSATGSPREMSRRSTGAEPQGERVTAAKLGLQLYTVRDAIKADMPGTLRRVAAMGFDGVETAFWPDGVTLAQAAAALDAARLPVSSCHVELPIGDKRQVFLDTAAAFRCKTMIWHGWPEDPRYGSLDGTKALARIYNDAHSFAKDNGLRFGLHNHWWEFRNTVGGRYVFEVLLDEIDPEIFFELDTYWLKVAGHDPATIVGRFGARAPLLHIKDGPAQFHPNLAADNPDPMTAVGQGTQDFPAIVRAAKGHTDWMVVEMDKTAGDVFVALQQSVAYLETHGLVRSRPPVRR